MADFTTTDAVAIYAAIVATGALALEIRRWFEAGPKLALTVIAKARIYGGIAPDESQYLSVRVTNRGDRPTTVTNFGLLQYESRYKQYQNQSSRSAIIVQPEGEWGPPLPHVLQPGTEWTGMAKYNDDLVEWAKTGKLYAAIHSSHARKPIVRKVNYST